MIGQQEAAHLPASACPRGQLAQTWLSSSPEQSSIASPLTLVRRCPRFSMATLTKELVEKDGQQSQKSAFQRLFKKGKTHPGTASEADTMSHMTMPCAKKKDRMPAVVIGAALFGSFGACFGAILDGYLAREEIERLAEETKEIQRQNEKRRNYGFQTEMLDDPKTVLEQAQANKAQLKRIEE